MNKPRSPFIEIGPYWRQNQTALLCTFACMVMLLSACGKLTSWPFQTPKNSPEEFFDGPYLNMAQAILEEDIPRLQRLSQRQDLNQKGRKGMSLMWFAIVHEKFAAIQSLVRLGAELEAISEYKINSVLHFSFTSPDLRFLKAILDGGFDPNYSGQPGYAPLMLERATSGTLEHVKLMLSYGARIDDLDSLGGTALTAAMYKRKPDIATYLVEQGADFNTHDVNGVSAMWVLNRMIQNTIPGNPIHEQFKDLRDLLIKKGVKWPPLEPEQVREKMRARGEPIGVLRTSTPPSRPWSQQ